MFNKYLSGHKLCMAWTPRLRATLATGVSSCSVVAEEWILCSVDEYIPFLNRPFPATLSWRIPCEVAAVAVSLW